MARKPGRPKTGAEILSRERILAAALQLVDASGVDQLTMRRLASVLGVDPMAIYRHLPDKAAVLNGMVELVFGEFQPPTVLGDWRAKVRAFAAAYRAVTHAHPHLVVYSVTHIEASGPAVLAVGEYLVAALSETGLPPIKIVTATNLIVDFLNGFVLGESTGMMAQAGEYRELYALLESLPADHYPAMRATYGALDEATLHAHIYDGLELILAGIEAWL